ncbi:transcription termination/antitermination protein NusG [Rathayibacter toxicus]|uniref:Transcription termination/antitermination protein NusG n=1 Tax=Rathayibacter toxicus TaxID=145458 RepID=A0A0C5BGB0_9MICO|nr:transcription termination/antitermination protein NusG [Rathayibacter toxicus]AJM78139.1 antitermination protein NusG [Rathayibacter toxicus]ALS57596.1 antitermination protein NusG [Rathayibacter toxicus]KKM44951.1 antitermination protein NusG [Rathayibacter toxicus]PPG20732.1 transcription termination/antitermination protein NusG [Rathayibacter toxicus]PPG45836.1 transcription termination/antitermination protein NusG [Rathayibacter toxicus]
MSDRNRDDVDWATAAEQSSEVEEEQEGSIQTRAEAAVEPAEQNALSIIDENAPEDALDSDREAALTAASLDDPEADSALNEASHIDTVEDEAEDAKAAGEDLADSDPYETFRNELRSKPGKWYVIHSYAGFEKRVKSNIENRKVSLEAEDYIFEVQVPMEDVVEIKNGQRKMVTRVRIPGYVLVRMDLNEDSWSVVRHTPGVTGFVGNAHNPTPLRFEEAFTMLKSLVEIKDVAPSKVPGAKGQKAAQRVLPAEVDFEIGETITIKEGSFAGLPGSISEIKPESGKLTVLVSLFERETPVELSFDQVTKL